MKSLDSIIKEYEEHTLLLESFLEFHPEAHPKLDSRLSDAERLAIQEFYVVDWDKEGAIESVVKAKEIGQSAKFDFARNSFRKWMDLNGFEAAP